MIYVFLGPSMPITEATALLEAVYLPPAVMGDVFRVARRRPRAIAIVDGCFEHTPAVWHKEILYALQQGVRVYGAASMGALRAAELQRFGMEGVGEIFAGYRDGLLEDDDEVAVAHGPAAEGYRLLSDPMVNIRDGLRQAREAGAIDRTACEQLTAYAKRLFYPERCWPRVIAQATEMGMPAAERDGLRTFIQRARPDLKKADTTVLLRRMRADLDASQVSSPPSFGFEPTVFWNRLVEATGPTSFEQAAGPGVAERARDLAGQVRRAVQHRREHLSIALLLRLVRAEAQRQGIAPDERTQASAVEAFRRRRHLLSAADTTRWLRDNRMDVQQLRELAELDWLCDELIRRLGGQLDDWVVAALRLGGGLPEALKDLEGGPTDRSSVHEGSVAEGERALT
jgi:hypothetical protein